MPVTFTELESAVLVKTPRDLFGDDVQAGLKRLRLIAHPDANPTMRDRATSLTATLVRMSDELTKPPVIIQSRKRRYSLYETIGIGDVADVRRATDDDGNAYAIKLSRVPEGLALLDNEKTNLTTLLAQAKAATYSYYLPTLVEADTIRDRIIRRFNVFTHEPRWYSLRQVMGVHPVLNARHIVWIFNRMLTILGFVHRQGIVHGAIVPDHVLINPDNHGLKLVGWGHSVPIGGVITSASARYLASLPEEVKQKKPASPATDIYMAVQCAGALAQDNLQSLPVPLRNFFGGCAQKSPGMRPDDAWKLYDEFKEVQEALYGPPKFIPFSMP
jgi:serine/threonine protein kinase